MDLKNYLRCSILSFAVLLYGCKGKDSNNETTPLVLAEEQQVSAMDTTILEEEFLPEEEGKVIEPVQATNQEKVKKEPEEKLPETLEEKLTEPEPVVAKIKPVANDKPKKTNENGCPESIKPYLDFDNKYGLLACEMNPESTTYHYYLVISKNKNFSSSNIIKSFDLNLNSVFPINTEQKDQLKKIKEYANLYFRYEIYCDKTKYQSQIEGPLSISCRDNGECQIMR